MDNPILGEYLESMKKDTLTYYQTYYTNFSQSPEPPSRGSWLRLGHGFYMQIEYESPTSNFDVKVNQQEDADLARGSMQKLCVV
jgi:hypothetical protein